VSAVYTCAVKGEWSDPEFPEDGRDCRFGYDIGVDDNTGVDGHWMGMEDIIIDDLDCPVNP
jgi:hypothetical protein